MSGFEFGRNPEDIKGDVTRGAPTLIVLPDLRQRGSQGLDAEARLEEAQGLALAIGLDVVDSFALPIRAVRPATLFGEGQVDKIGVACEQSGAELVVVDGALSAIQQRNLESKLGRRIWITRPGVWCDRGPTLNASAAALAFSVAPAKPRSRPTVA